MKEKYNRYNVNSELLKRVIGETMILGCHSGDGVIEEERVE